MVKVKQKVKQRLKSNIARKRRRVDRAERSGNMDTLVDEMVGFVELLNLGHRLGVIKPTKLKWANTKPRKTTASRNHRHRSR